MAPLRNDKFCWAHSPEHAQEAQEARRLGGQRRKKEIMLSGAYDLEGIDNIPGIRRVLEIAVLDTLASENNLSRNRTLGYLMQVALKAMEAGETEERLAALEQAVLSKQIQHEPIVFDAENGESK
jgi:hypothetical protein